MTRPLKLTISRVKGGTGNSKYRVNGLKNAQGRRQRKFFPTKKAAEEFCDHTQDLYRREGYEGASLTQEERATATACIRRLARAGKTLSEVTDAALSESRVIDRSKKVAAAVTGFLEAQKADGRRPRYIADLRQVLKKFTDAFGVNAVCEIRTAAIDGWLRDSAVGGVARNNRRRVLHVFFEYAVTQGYANANPVTQAAVAKVTEPKKEIFTIAAASALMAASDDAMCPYVAIALFAGLRTRELAVLDWKCIDMESAVIEVDGESAKGRSQRFVPIQPNLLAWLKPHARAEGRVAPANAKRRLLATRIEAGFIDDMTGKATPLKNHARHSFGSYRLAVIHDEKKVAREMGNSAAIVNKHYARPIPEAIAMKFWAIMPPNAVASPADAPTLAKIPLAA